MTIQDLIENKRQEPASVDETRQCLRGLESSLRKGRKTIVWPVLELQKELKLERMVDKKGLYIMSKTISKEACRQARRLGLADGREATSVWEDRSLNGSCDVTSHESSFKLSKNIIERSYTKFAGSSSTSRPWYEKSLLTRSRESETESSRIWKFAGDRSRQMESQYFFETIRSPRPSKTSVQQPIACCA